MSVTLLLLHTTTPRVCIYNILLQRAPTKARIIALAVLRATRLKSGWFKSLTSPAATPRYPLPSPAIDQELKSIRSGLYKLSARQQTESLSTQNAVT